MKKVLFGLIVMVMALTGCSRATTQASEASVNTEGYIFFPTDPKVNGCTPPQNSQYLGAGDKASIYPAGLRNYVFDSDEGSDHGPIPLTTSDNATMGLVGYITFRLVTPKDGNDDKRCDVFQRFHKEIGQKDYNGFKAEVNNDEYRGWNQMLDEVIGKPLEAVVADLGSGNQALKVYKDEAVRDAIEKAVTVGLPEKVAQATDGGDYFEIVSVSLSKPEPPADLVKALNDATVADQENANASKRNLTAKTKYAQITECTDKGISEASCVLLYGINSGAIQVLPQGTGVVLPPRK